MATTANVVDLELTGGIAVITVDSPPVNALSRAVRDGLMDALDRAEAAQADAVVLLCAGRTFIAGADISEFGQSRAGASLADLCARIENFAVSVVAAIHGSALGGGLEIALCAHHRVAAQGASLGFPEINLGLTPGAGGTQRLPRLIGLERSLDMLTRGKPIAAASALECGLIDEAVPEGDLRASAVAAATQRVGSTPRRTCALAVPVTSNETVEAYRTRNARKFRGNPAFDRILDCLLATMDGRTFEKGLAFEDACFHALLHSPESKALRYGFKAQRRAPVIAGLSADIKPAAIASVGIVGAGTMGGGIAMACADAGLAVTLVDTRQEGLDKGLATIARNYERAVTAGRIDAAERDRRLSLICGSLDIAELAGVDLAIEAVFEQFAVKEGVFKALDAVCKTGAILASNTSAIDLNRIAAATSRPESVVGLHFFSPANVMRLLEIIRGASTSETVLASGMAFARKLGKIAVVSGVCPGFIANRMLKQRQNQSQLLLLEGAMPWDVDRVLEDFGFPMGPFAMSDLVGLDLGWTAATSTGATMRDVLCENGRRGQKTGGGYYDYDDDRQRRVSPVAEALIRDFVAARGHLRDAISDEEILARCIYPVINEGAKILEEGIAQRGSDIDVAWVNGFAWPAGKGGPMYFADEVGLGTVAETLERLHAHDPAIAPPAPLLVQLARENARLSEYELLPPR